MTFEGFTGITSDLKTSLTSVRSLSEILHDYPNLDGSKRREFVGIILQETKRMTGLIKHAESPVASTTKSEYQTQNTTTKTPN